VDSCGHDAQTSAFSQTIFLQATPNSDRTNTLSWNNYQGWLGGISSYDIYRSIDGGPYVLLTNVSFPVTTYVDDVDPFFTSNGKFTYYVTGHEAAMNVYNLQENSNSNPADCYQFSHFFIPNAFAPSGVNTVFLPMGSYYDKGEYSMLIFDRWGELLFENSDPTIGWDGTYKGERCRQGVYVYLIKYRSSIGEMIEQKGTVTLLGK
jgi:gliding motility-associated-like protein